MSVTLILADDHPIVRQGLRHLLEGEPGFLILAEAGDGLEALRLVELLKPKILIVDMMMPDISGDRVIRMIRENPENRTKPILVLSALHSLDAQRRARESGANQFLPKNTPLPELLQHITHLLH